MARIGGRTVYITKDDNTVVQLNPGDTVPAKLERYFVGDGKQHRALAGDAAPAGDRVDEKTADASDYESHNVQQLRGLLKDRELPQDGNKAELIARLNEDDASAEVEDDESDTGEQEV